MSKKHDLPAMPFYVGDWLKCPEVRALPLDYRALWFDLICFMWESSIRGVMVKTNGIPYTKDEIIRMVGLDNQNSTLWLTYLIENHVCSVRDDGAIYSKRMVKNEEIRILRAKGGEKGGNPNLKVNFKVKQTVKQNPETETEYETEVVNTTKRNNIPPTFLEVQEYCKERNNGINAQAFIDHYQANGWMRGKSKIKDWKACIRTWESNQTKGKGKVWNDLN